MWCRSKSIDLIKEGIPSKSFVTESMHGLERTLTLFYTATGNRHCFWLDTVGCFLVIYNFYFQENPLIHAECFYMCPLLHTKVQCVNCDALRFKECFPGDHIFNLLELACKYTV